MAALLLALAGHNPFEVYRLLAVKSFGGARRIAATLSSATPLILTGLATAIAFRAGVFNVGVEGCFFVGGLAAASVGFTFAGLGRALIPARAAAAAAVGAAWMFIPGWLLARLDVDEVVSTLMLNFIAIASPAIWSTAPVAPGRPTSRPEFTRPPLPRLMPPSTLHSGFMIALALLVLYGSGSAGRRRVSRPAGSGSTARFARASGIAVPVTIIVDGPLGRDRRPRRRGHGLGQLRRFTDGFSAGYGFTGMAVALLGRDRPVGMLPRRRSSSGRWPRRGRRSSSSRDIPLDLVNIIQGIVMIFAVVGLAASA